MALDSDAAFNATNPSGFVGSLAFGPGIVAIATGDGYSANNLLVSGVQTIGQVANVPEPATWMMMIAGLGLICAQLRRRKPLVSFA
ncbi:MAG: PEP-CTERM sorting domain-containing protein [Spirochaetia bacterium]|nr:MAG: PEP-CTERM sorting domain-containing protein [Spirochaetia bacterium]